MPLWLNGSVGGSVNKAVAKSDIAILPSDNMKEVKYSLKASANCCWSFVHMTINMTGLLCKPGRNYLFSFIWTIPHLFWQSLTAGNYF